MPNGDAPRYCQVRKDERQYLAKGRQLSDSLEKLCSRAWTMALGFSIDAQ